MEAGEGGPKHKLHQCVCVCFTIAAVFLVRKVIRCLWMFQKTKGEKSRFHVKIFTWGPLTLRTEPQLGMLRGVISVKQQLFLTGGGVRGMQFKRKGVARASPGEDALAWPSGSGIQVFLLSHTQLVPNRESRAKITEGSLPVCLLQEVWWEAGLWEKVKKQSSTRGIHQKYVRLVILMFQSKIISPHIRDKVALNWFLQSRWGNGLNLVHSLI